MLTIRTATESESVVVAALMERIFVDTYAALSDPAPFRAYVDAAFAPAQIAAELADPAATFLLAERDGTPIACAKLHVPSGAPPDGVQGAAPIELVRFYVDHAHHGSGVAHELMHVCLDRAIAAGCRTMFLDVWERNPRAMAFYRKWGFEVVGERTFMLADDAQRDIVMALAW